ncbi:MAG: DUF454 family protein [Bacteroidetes bacterium]|nr:DUF454 family protein [Bacteroidota bacterium]
MNKRLTEVDDIVEKYSVVKNPFKRRLYAGLGFLCVVFAIIGIWIPGWPTISWAVPAAFLFSLSNKKLFRWSLTNNYFGKEILEYYGTGKTLSRHVKIWISIMIALMSGMSSYLVWYISTKGEGFLLEPTSWSGKDQYGFGAISILLCGFFGVLYVLTIIKSRE